MASEIDLSIPANFQLDLVSLSSVSFGRFEKDELMWERRSSFSHNRHVADAEKYSKPGSVVEKKAYFEAHFRRKGVLPGVIGLQGPSEEEREIIDDVSDNSIRAEDVKAETFEEPVKNECENSKDGDPPCESNATDESIQLLKCSDTEEKRTLDLKSINGNESLAGRRVSTKSSKNGLSKETQKPTIRSLLTKYNSRNDATIGTKTREIYLKGTPNDNPKMKYDAEKDKIRRSLSFRETSASASVNGNFSTKVGLANSKPLKGNVTSKPSILRSDTKPKPLLKPTKSKPTGTVINDAAMRKGGTIKSNEDKKAGVSALVKKGTSKTVTKSKKLLNSITPWH